MAKIAAVASDHPKAGDAATETDVLADWIATFRLDNVPAEIVKVAKHCILDSFGCMIAGLGAPACALMQDLLCEHSPGPFEIPGARNGVSILAASYLLSQAANALDFDDSFRDGAPSHPGATVVPPGYVMSAHLRRSGADLLAAAIIGYEISLRVGRATQPTPQRKDAVYGFSTWQVFSAVSAAASLLQLPPAQIAHAIGLAAVHAPLPSLRKLGTDDPMPYPWIKNSYGAASEAGVWAALLAQKGYLGHPHIFEGRRGFWVMAGSDRYDPAQLTEGLGRRWLMEGVGFKPYGCCRWTHTMLDAIRACLARSPGKTIASVRIEAFRELANLTAGYPTSIVDAQFHAPYLAALELSGKSPEFGLQADDLRSAAVAELVKKIEVIHVPQLDEDYYKTGALPVKVSLSFTDGSREEQSLRDPTGSPAAGGLSQSLLEDKFMRLVSGRLPEKTARDLADALLTLESRSTQSIAELMRC